MTLLGNRRSRVVGDLLNGAVPGYQGHVPGHRIEDVTCGHVFARGVEAGRHSRSVPTLDAQGLRDSTASFKGGSMSRRALTASSPQPRFDTKGVEHPISGDFLASRIPASGEAKTHYQSNLGLTSRIYEQPDCLEASRLPRGTGSGARSAPGCTVHIPGKRAQNVFGDGWSKSNERSLGEHTRARQAAKQGRGYEMSPPFLVPRADAMVEAPLFNPAYNGSTRGWSDCKYTGVHVDPAGMTAPTLRQKALGSVPPVPAKSIPGYSGWVPCRMGDNVVGVRQRECAEISGRLEHNNRTIIVQR